jgi:hypothetical protein
VAWYLQLFLLCHLFHLPGFVCIKGVEALLTVLADRCGFQHPGDAFLAAVDVMLEKPAVLQEVQQLLEQCADAVDGETFEKVGCKCEHALTDSSAQSNIPALCF